LSAAKSDIASAGKAINAVSGTTPKVMRPPYGATSQALVDAIGMSQILWSVDTLDWKYRDSTYVKNYVLTNAKRGDIVLMHDIHPTSVAAVPGILKGLKAKGYTMVTIDTLLGKNLPPDRYRKQNLN
jgi:peptidoglycan/xylan/chitin deacetylase (PgdA/CDA1 family)